MAEQGMTESASLDVPEDEAITIPDLSKIFGIDDDEIDPLAPDAPYRGESVDDD